MRYFNLHTHHESRKPSVFELVNQYPHAFQDDIRHYSIGIHPWHIVQERVDDDLMVLEAKLKLEPCLAVGECGLDKRVEVPLELQMMVFEKQLLLAETYRKPVIIHCVAAFQELIALKNRLNLTVPLVIHGFSKNQQTAKQLLDQGFYLSFGKYLLRNPELEPVFVSVPADRFFLETDTIEEDISRVYEVAARYRQISQEALEQQIASNFEIVFNTTFIQS